MTFNKAINEARSHVQLVRAANQWVVIGPFFFDKPDGPTTHSSPTNYWLAQAKAKEWRANIALHLLDAWSYDSEHVAINTDGDLRTRVRAGLRVFK